MGWKKVKKLSKQQKKTKPSIDNTLWLPEGKQDRVEGGDRRGQGGLNGDGRSLGYEHSVQHTDVL